MCPPLPSISSSYQGPIPFPLYIPPPRSPPPLPKEKKETKTAHAFMEEEEEEDGGGGVRREEEEAKRTNGWRETDRGRRRKKKGGSLPLPRGGGSVGTVQGRQWTGGGERERCRERERREKGLARKCKDRSIDRATGGEEAAADPTTTYVPTKSFPPLSSSLFACLRVQHVAQHDYFSWAREGGRDRGGKQVRFRTLGGETFRPKGPDTLHEKKVFVRNGARRKKDRKRERESRSTFLSFLSRGGRLAKQQQVERERGTGGGRKWTEGPTILRMRREKE